MKPSQTTLLLIIPLIAGLLPGPARAETIPILVDVLPFKTVEEAAQAEATVDWMGPDTRRQNACTLAYAALELKTHLEKLEWKDGSSPAFPFHSATGTVPRKAFILTTLRDVNGFDGLKPAVERLDLATQLREPGSFALVPDGDRLFLVGSDRAGTLYSVYHYLESLGIRWYGPSEAATYLPTSPELHFPGSTAIESPDFATRGFWVGQDRSNRPFYVWMARNRMNFWSIVEPNRAFLQKLGMRLSHGGHSHFATFLNSHDPYPYEHPLYDGDEDKPEDPYPANPDSYRGDADEDGVLSYFEARPEWYGMIDGERTPFEGHLKQANICTSNPQAVDHLLDGIMEELAEGDWRDVTYFNFWPVDMGKWCECDACTPLGTPTDKWLLLVHALNEEVKKATESGRLHRDVKIVFPIYLETLDAPTRPLPEGFDYDSCIGTFFPIHRCYVHTIDDPDCLEYNTDHWNTFLDWIQRSPRYYHGELFVGEYFNVSVNKSLPVLYSRIIHEDVPTFFEHGVRHMHYMHTDTRLLGLKRINNYLFAKKLWDTEAHVPSLLNAYYENIYGPVAREMKSLGATLEFALSNIKQIRYWHHLPERISERQMPLFNKEHFQLEESHPEQNDGVDLAQSVRAMQRCREIMDALMARNLEEPLQSLILLDDKMLCYGENTVYYYDAVARAVLAEAEGDLDGARAAFKKSLPFARALKAETVLVKTAVNHHVHAEDGLDATRTEEAYIELGKRLFDNFVF